MLPLDADRVWERTRSSLRSHIRLVEGCACGQRSDEREALPITIEEVNAVRNQAQAFRKRQ